MKRESELDDGGDSQRCLRIFVVSPSTFVLCALPKNCLHELCGMLDSISPARQMYAHEACMGKYL